MTLSTRTASATAIDPATTVGLLSLTVANLARSVAFYTEAIGLTALDQDETTATLGVAGTPLLLLTERAGAKPWPREQASYTGLYHFALLVPTRADLGRWVRHWLTLGLPLGQGDHRVSEALYISDPDENGIEVYRDRPRDEWQWANGQVQMGADPVDIRGLLAEAERAGEPWSGLPAGTRLGHIHLQVGDISEAAAFYHDLLGFGIVAGMPSALFVSAGGYHHHIGMNTWHSKGATPAPADMVGLRFFTVNFPTEAARKEVLDRIVAAGLPTTQIGDAVSVQDPWQNTLLLTKR
ncbi:MAG: VOC family protein [Thermomicrobia bacterium]|nr:VOC family protein [Thermomicrobia bacterium]